LRELDAMVGAPQPKTAYYKAYQMVKKEAQRWWKAYVKEDDARVFEK
jgi:hypothetical protein